MDLCSKLKNSVWNLVCFYKEIWYLVLVSADTSQSLVQF